MNDGNWEDAFSSYDIDLMKAKTSSEAEHNPPEEEVASPQEPVVPDHEEPVVSEHEESESEPVDNVYTESPEVVASREKVKENKATYDRLLARFNNQEPQILKKEDVEKAVASMDECIVALQQLHYQDPTDSPVDKRQARKRRIVSQQLSGVTDALVTAKYLGLCFIDIDQEEYYKYLGDHRYILMTSQTSRTYHANSAIIFDAATAQQSKDALDKITASTERLAYTLAEIINFFPSEGGLTALLGRMVDKADEKEIESFSQTIQMAAKQGF